MGDDTPTLSTALNVFVITKQKLHHQSDAEVTRQLLNGLVKHVVAHHLSDVEDWLATEHIGEHAAAHHRSDVEVTR